MGRLEVAKEGARNKKLIGLICLGDFAAKGKSRVTEKFLKKVFENNQIKGE